MGCHSSKAPTPATPVVGLPADFDLAKTLLESPPPGGNAEIKKESSMRTEPGDVEKNEAPETSPDKSADASELLWHRPMSSGSDSDAQPYRGNWANLSPLPSLGEMNCKAHIPQLPMHNTSLEQQGSVEAPPSPRGGGNTATSRQNSADAQDALKAQKLDTETTEASSEITPGLRTIADPIAPKVSKIVNKSAEEVAAAKAAIFDIKTATDIGILQGNEHCIVQPKKADDKKADSSVANSTSTRKQRFSCC